MNSLQIKQLLGSNKHFGGVFPSNHLITIKDKKQKGFIVNTDDCHKPGVHWVAFYFPANGRPEFFDSYGHKISLTDFYNFIGRKKYYYNNRLLQSALSTLCAGYCIYFLSERIKGKKFKDIVTQFKTNTLINDFFIQKYIEKKFNFKLKFVNKKFKKSVLKKFFK